MRAVLIGLTLVATFAAGSSSAATLTVNSTADVLAADGACTLREAVIAANTDTALLRRLLAGLPLP